MKKIFAFVIATAMAVSMIACGSGDKDNNETTITVNTEMTTTKEDTQAGKESVIAPEISEDSMGGKLWNTFFTEKQANAAITPEELANKLIENPVIQFAPGTMAVEPGYLAGFNTEIGGFEKGAVYQPMMGSIAFVGYVFDLAADADVNAFIKTLEDNANMRWQVCVSADKMVSGAYNNTVFFLMYQSDLAGEGPAEDMNMEPAVIIEPVVEDGTWGKNLWDTFVADMDAMPVTSAVDEAFMLSMAGSITFTAGSAEVMEGYLAGFDGEITGFKSAGMFCPMISSEPFVGYVFELDESADVNAFMSMLSSKANPNWQVCVTAEQTVVGAYNNKVFFLMCPKSNQPAAEK